MNWGECSFRQRLHCMRSILEVSSSVSSHIVNVNGKSKENLFRIPNLNSIFIYCMGDTNPILHQLCSNYIANIRKSSVVVRAIVCRLKPTQCYPQIKSYKYLIHPRSLITAEKCPYKKYIEGTRDITQNHLNFFWSHKVSSICLTKIIDTVIGTSIVLIFHVQINHSWISHRRMINNFFSRAHRWYINRVWLLIFYLSWTSLIIIFFIYKFIAGCPCRKNRPSSA